MIARKARRAGGFVAVGVSPRSQERPHQPAPRSGATRYVSPLRGYGDGVALPTVTAMRLLKTIKC
jgi:hypothetical protein